MMRPADAERLPCGLHQRLSRKETMSLAVPSPEPFGGHQSPPVTLMVATPDLSGRPCSSAWNLWMPGCSGQRRVSVLPTVP
jgi:hypothetical protein